MEKTLVVVFLPRLFTTNLISKFFYLESFCILFLLFKCPDYKTREQPIVLWLAHCKQLLDEVFVISRIIKVEVRVISRSRRLRLITLTETLIILDITKTETYNCFIIH